MRDQREQKSDMEMIAFRTSELRAETREEGDGSPKRIISGVAIVFNQETMIGRSWWAFREVIRPGALTKTLNEQNQKALFGHDPNMPLANRDKGTLQLKTSKVGLEFIIELGNRTWDNDLYESVLRGDIEGNSFGFWPKKDRWTESDDIDELPLLERLEIELVEISPTAFPAYPTTSIEARAKRIIETAERNGRLKFMEMRRQHDELERRHDAVGAETTSVQVSDSHSEAGGENRSPQATVEPEKREEPEAGAVHVDVEMARTFNERARYLALRGKGNGYAVRD
jgi:HK97 family phage prohead protease